jgi:hypothetical protein
MSQLPSAPRPASRSPTDGRNISLPTVQGQDDGSKIGLAEGRMMHQDLEGQAAVQASQQVETMQPPQVSQAATLEDEQRGVGSSRSLGVHNILNPPETEPSGSSTPRLGTAIASSPQPVSQVASYMTNPPLFPQGYVGQQTGPTVTAAEGQRTTSTRGRKYAPLKSPRAVSLGGRTATRDARQSPFLSSRGVYTAEPGSGPLSEIPPMPAPPGTAQQYGGYAVAAPPRRASTTTMSAPTRTPLSQSASPSASIQSSYSQPSQSSPAVRHQLGQPPNPQYYPGQSYGTSFQQGEASPHTGPPGTEGPYMTSLPESLLRGSQRGQNPHLRLMPFSNELGEMLIEVDVQAASKMADEKRARNAGASARFRERRKQKEKEASQNIEKLNTQLRDLERRLREAEHDRDFYRGERDRFREFCFRNPSTREFASNVPPSPRISRQAAFPPAGATYQTSEGGTSQDAERPAIRRRTDDYSFPASSLAPYQGPSYGTGTGPGAGQPPTTLPPLRMPNVAMATTTGPPTFSNPPSATTRPPTFDQYPRSGYERGWPGDGGQRQ